MEDAPDVDVLCAFHVEDQVRKALQGPTSQTWKIQLVSVSRRPCGRMASHVGVGMLERIDKAQCNMLPGLAQVVIYGLFGIPDGSRTRDHGLVGHLVRGLRTRSRRLEK